MSQSEGLVTNDQTKAALASWESYCKKHDCDVLHNIVPPHPSLHFFSARWDSLLYSRMWRTYEWLLHVDDDVVVLNASQPMEAFTADGAHMVFAMRENNEIAAGVVMIRTSNFSQCFIQQWSNYGMMQRSNWDNGDLMQAVLDYADPDLARYCETLRRELKVNQTQMTPEDWNLYRDEFLACFTRVHPRLPYLQLSMPLRFYFTMTGLFQTMKSTAPSQTVLTLEQALWEGMYYHCWSTDFLRHSLKQVAAIQMLRSNDTQRSCTRLSRSAELLIAQKCCLWHYPGCTNATGYNVCRHQPHCVNATVGMPLRACQEYHTPWVWKQALLMPMYTEATLPDPPVIEVPELEGFLEEALLKGGPGGAAATAQKKPA